MTQIILIIISLLFLGVLVGANIYLSKRFAWFFNVRKTRYLYIAFASLTVFMLLGIPLFTNSTSFVASLLYSASSIIMGILLYLLLSVILIHLLQVLVKFPRRIYGFLAIGLTLVISGLGVLNAYSLRVTEIEVSVEGLEKEMRAVHFSDVHIGHLRDGEFVRKIVDLGNDLDPDLVFITGDLFDGRINLNRESLAALSDFMVPVYFVEGNHDKYTGAGRIKDYLRELGVKVLENELVQQDGIQIIGLNHMIPEDLAYKMHMSPDARTIKDVLSEITTDPTKPLILMHHSPDGIEYANDKGVDLYLAGHTHGGQVFPVNLIGEWMFTYNRGLDDYQGTKIFVSQGVGTWGPPMRVGTRSEVALIKLIP